MKKILSATVFAGLTLSLAATAGATSIDSAGIAKVCINKPSAAITAKTQAAIALDSAGSFTAAPVKVVTATVSPAKAEGKQTCLDSTCQVIL